MAEAAERDLWVVSSDEEDEELQRVFGTREKTPMPNSDDSESDWSQPKSRLREEEEAQQPPPPKECSPTVVRRGISSLRQQSPRRSLDSIESGASDPEISF